MTALIVDHTPTSVRMFTSLLLPELNEDYAYTWQDLAGEDPDAHGNLWSPRAESGRYIWFGLNKIDMDVIERVIRVRQVRSGDVWTDQDRQNALHVCTLLRINCWFDKRYKFPTFDKKVWLELPDWMYYVWESLVANGLVPVYEEHHQHNVQEIVGDDWDASTVTTVSTDFSFESFDDVTLFPL